MKRHKTSFYNEKIHKTSFYSTNVHKSISDSTNACKISFDSTNAHFKYVSKYISEQLKEPSQCLL